MDRNTIITKRIFNTALVGIVTFWSSAIFWVGAVRQANELMSLTLFRPFVYRQLTFSVARLLTYAGVRADWALVFVMTIAGVGFYLALYQLILSFYPDTVYGDRVEWTVLILTCLGLVIFSNERISYDMATAWFWTLALYYISSAQDRQYAVLFPLICLNRETAILLLPLFVWTRVIKNFFGWQLGLTLNWLMIFYQVMCFFLIQNMLHVLFSGNGGANAWIDPVHNLLKFANQPARTFLHLVVSACLLLLIFYGWYSKPLFLRWAFMLYAPIFTALYLVMGQAFEVRVLWEVYPAMAALMFPSLMRLKFPLPLRFFKSTSNI
jgi:hypothetical protein